jgi:isopentenyl-diphosphate delta-isomerase
MNGVHDTDPPTRTASRKEDHIDINLHRQVQARDVTTGFEQIQFVHSALPELDFAAVNVETSFLGHRLGAPLLISGMTGGIERGWEITRTLATVAQKLGLAMGVGSQRAALENDERAKYFQVRDVAPDVLLFSNLGAVQLNYGYGVDACRRAVEMIGADALVLHLNPLQEALQPEGNRNFSNLLVKIEAICRWLDRPVIVKEVGCGLSADVARSLADAGVAALDVGGMGGTSWSAVEHHRADTDLGRRMSETFVDWGIPTMVSLEMALGGAPGVPIVASGGMRTSLDAAKAIALGASMAGFAGPMLSAAVAGEERAHAVAMALIEELRLAMFCSGAGTIEQLQRVPLMTADWQRKYRVTDGSHFFDGKAISHGFQQSL